MSPVTTTAPPLPAELEALMRQLKMPPRPPWRRNPSQPHAPTPVGRS